MKSINTHNELYFILMLYTYPSIVPRLFKNIQKLFLLRTPSEHSGIAPILYVEKRSNAKTICASVKKKKAKCFFYLRSPISAAG